MMVTNTEYAEHKQGLDLQVLSAFGALFIFLTSKSGYQNLELPCPYQHIRMPGPPTYSIVERTELVGIFEVF